MNRSLLLAIGGVLAGFVMSLHAQAGLLYSNDFEGVIGSEWSSSRTETESALSTFLGRFSDNAGASVPGSVGLSLPGLPQGAYELVFDLYVLDQWDGSRGNSGNGPDYFNVSVDGASLFHETFANAFADSDGAQTYPPPRDGRADYGGALSQDAIYRNVTVPFSATDSSSQITFSSQLRGVNSLNDESWGIDNVRIRRGLDPNGIKGPVRDPKPDQQVDPMPRTDQMFMEFAYRRQIFIEGQLPAGTLDLAPLHADVPIIGQIAERAFSLDFDGTVPMAAIDIAGHFAVPRSLQSLFSRISIDKPWNENVESGSITVEAIAGVEAKVEQGADHATFEFAAGLDAGVTMGVPLEPIAFFVHELRPLADILHLAGLDPKEVRVGIPFFDDGIPLPFPKSLGIIAEFEEPYEGDGFSVPLSAQVGVGGVRVEYRSTSQFFLDQIPEGTVPDSPRLSLSAFGKTISLNDQPQVTSPSGTVDVTEDNMCVMETGSPVWSVFLVDVEDEVNFLSFTVDFLSAEGAEGLLRVFWDGELVVEIDERVALAGEEQLIEFLPDTVGPGSYELAFRLDPYTDIPSSVAIGDVTTGFLAIPEPVTAVWLLIGWTVALQRRRR